MSWIEGIMVIQVGDRAGRNGKCRRLSAARLNFQRPGDVLAYQCAGMLAAPRQCLCQRWISYQTERVAQRHGNVAQPAFMPDTSDRTALGEAQKFFLGPAKQSHQLTAHQTRAFSKIGQGAALCELVP